MTGKSTEQIGVLLLNLGGPDRLQDVESFLYNLFSDRQIIRLSPFPFLQKPLARFIANRRAPKSCKAYKQIGGGSPLKKITGQQGKDLEKLLGRVSAFEVGMAMRYWYPSAEEALKTFAGNGISRIVALTLYPHYSLATTGSSIIDLKKAAGKLADSFQITSVKSWPDQPEYIHCLVRAILREVGRLPAGCTVIYSAHSLPVRFIEEGDPYLDDLAKTITAVEEQTGIRGKLCFQSRSGPVTWLAPSTPDTLAELAEQGVKDVVIVPISFVSDHVETLYEIDIQYRELAEDLGLKLHRTRSLNTEPEFIKGLAKLVIQASYAKGWLDSASVEQKRK
jgi:ferrochelatase